MTIQPLHDNVVIRPAIIEKTTKTGIVLPDNVDKGRSEQGTVVAIGMGRILDSGAISKMSVKVGDKVMFKPYPINEIKIDGQDYLLVSDADILAII